MRYLIFALITAGMTWVLYLAGRPLHVAPIEGLVCAIVICLGGWIAGHLGRLTYVLWAWLRQHRLVHELSEKIIEADRTARALRLNIDRLSKENSSERSGRHYAEEQMKYKGEKWQHSLNEIDRLNRQLAAYKAQVTKLRRQLGLPVKRGAK